jgi:hypothetical protein
MKTMRIFLFISFILFCSPSIADNQSYSEDDQVSDYNEATDVVKDNMKNKKETSKYRYDIEIYPYISVKYTSVNVKEEEIFIDEDV